MEYIENRIFKQEVDEKRGSVHLYFYFWVNIAVLLECFNDKFMIKK